MSTTSEATSNTTEQTTTTTTNTDTTSISSITSPPPSTTTESQTVVDPITTTTSSVQDPESTRSTTNTSTANNDGSTSSDTSTDTTAESTSTSVTSNTDTSPDAPPTSTSDTTIESTSTDTTTSEETTPTSTSTSTSTDDTAITLMSADPESTSVETQTATSGETETTATNLTTITDTASGTATSISEPTTVTDVTSGTTTTVSEPTTTVTDTTSETATTLSESTTATDTTSETATTVSETTTVADTTSETATTASETTTVADTTSETATTVSEPTTVTDATTTAATVSEPTDTDVVTAATLSPASLSSTQSADITTTGSGALSSAVTNTESQTTVQTSTETATRTVSDSTTQTQTGTSVAQTETDTSVTSVPTETVSETSTLQSASSNGSGTTVASSGASGAGTLVVSPSAGIDDVLTDVNTSDLGILTQSSLPTAEALSLSSIAVTYTTTEFATSTLSDGGVTVVPTRTRTVTGSEKPTYTLQPNEFERNKGTIIGGIVAAVVLTVAGIFIGIWLCRRQRPPLGGRRSSLFPFVLIPGHPSGGERSLNSQEWRPPLVGEIGDDEGDTNARRGDMSERRSVDGTTPVAYRDRPASPHVDSAEITSLASSAQDSTIQFGTSLLSFDGPQHPPDISRFSDSSSTEGGVRTASLISLSAEPTPIDSRFSHASSTSGTIPIISPFADSFSTQEAARNSYWGTGTTRPSTPRSSEEAAPKRSESIGTQNSVNAQSMTSSERGWKEIEIEENIPRPPGRASVPMYDFIVSPYNPFETENTLSLMSQVSLLNPPTRPSFHTTLTDLIHQSRPPMLPEISPAMTDDSFHPEGLLADHAYAQGGSEVNSNASRTSVHSLLDHVDYSRPIIDSSPTQSMAFDDITFRMSRGTESSSEEGGGFDSSENPFRDPVPNDEDLLNDVSPVLTMLQRGTASKASVVNVSSRT